MKHILSIFLAFGVQAFQFKMETHIFYILLGVCILVGISIIGLYI